MQDTAPREPAPTEALARSMGLAPDTEGALLADAAHIASVGAWSYDPAVGRVRMSDETLAIHGLPAGTELSLEDTLAFYDESSRPQMRDAVRAALLHGTPFDHEVGFVDTRGHHRWVRVVGDVQRRAGSVVRIAGLLHDVTERHESRSKIVELTERLRLATEVAGVGAWEWRIDTWEVTWSEQMYRLHGVAPQDIELTANRWLEFVVEADRQRLSDTVAQAYRKGGSIDEQYVIRRGDGQLRHVHTIGRTLQLPGQPPCMIGANIDVTDREYSARAQLDKESAERANRAKSMFLSRVSHELRTPLNGVLGFAQLLQEGELGVVQRQQIVQLRAAGEHLQALIDDMLDLASIEAGELRLIAEPVNVMDVVQAAATMTAPLATEHGVTVMLDAALQQPDPRELITDRMRLRQVLVNLLSNAIKYNRRGGEVRVSWSMRGGELELSVRDNGPGLRPAQLAQLFQPFNRLGAEASTVPGTGLGLAITRRLLDSMNGQIRFESQAGRGSTVTVSLGELQRPSASPATGASTPAGAAPASPARSVRILYIEDNPVNMTLMEHALALKGDRFVLHTAVDGESGLAWLRSGAELPDLVLLDINLPGMSGHDVLRDMRAQSRLAALRCIAVSADAMPDEVARALAEGFDDYWTKPLDIARLPERIEAALKLRR